jgi:F-type H+-transporting ATPase subunit delta
VKAFTSIELDDEQKTKLKEKLKVKYRHEVELENVIDSSVIAGIRLQIDNEIMDYSIKTQFSNLKSHILKQT